MNGLVKNIIFKNISYAVMANGINLLISIASAFIIPKLFGVAEYSYWQLYLFYTTYIGFFHFGWADGLYLREGGKQYDELDKEDMAAQFRMYCLLETVVAFLIVLIALSFIQDKNRQFVMICTAGCLLFYQPTTFLQYILQTTGRIKDYAKCAVRERLIYAAIVVLLLVIGVRNYWPLLLADLFSKSILIFSMVFLCRDIVFRKVNDMVKYISEAYENIRIGSRLMFANIAGILITGIVKFSIEYNWGIETFGKTSLTMTASNMVLIFISAISIVMYPMLKNISKEQLISVYYRLRDGLLIFTLGMLLCYYPLSKLLSIWLPQYADSLKYMGLLFPICVFESKTTMLTNTYFKAIREETAMMQVNWISVIFTFLFTAVTAFVYKNLTVTMLGLTVVLGFKSSLAEYVLGRYIDIKVKTDIAIEWCIIIVFCIMSWKFSGWRGECGYLAVYIIYLIYRSDKKKKRGLREG